MNLDLEEILNKNHIVYEHLEKKSKVKLLSKWIREFPELVSSGRQQKNHYLNNKNGYRGIFKNYG